MNPKKLQCPLCGSSGTKALLGPFPVKICEDPECFCLWGAWSGIAVWFYELFDPPGDDEDTFVFFAYSGGSYLAALWNMLRGHHD